MARRSRGAPSQARAGSVTWRDGVHLTDTPIWCDARRRRDVCFVSSADRVGRTGHGQLIASPLTLALLGAAGDGHLGVPLHRRFTLGTVRLELIASGRGPGAAALHVDIGGKTVLYAGAIRTQSTSLIEGAEVRNCDALVVAAPSARKLPPLAKTIEKTIRWTAQELAAGRRPVLVVETPLDGLEVAMCLAAADIAIAGARPIREAVQRAHALEASAPPALRSLMMSAPSKEPRATIWLARDRGGLARLAPSSVTTLGADGDVPWSSAAGRDELLVWIESANAREVYVTGAAADDIARAIGAKVLGPPQQMTLFEAVP